MNIFVKLVLVVFIVSLAQSREIVRYVKSSKVDEKNNKKYILIPIQNLKLILCKLLSVLIPNILFIAKREDSIRLCGYI